MRKREDEKVLLIVETTNWLESVEIMFDSGACVERIKG